MNADDYLKIHRRSKEDWLLDKIELYQLDPLDEDGYPTEEVLEYIKRWHWSDAKAMFEYIKDMWNYADCGYWREEIVYKDDYNGMEYEKPKHRYYISTAGWSGNESIIYAMQENNLMWSLNWVQSRRGGHYIFELELEDGNNQ
jgi:hypothetical protein